MQAVYDLGNGMRMVDLSKLVDPATETRRCKLYRFNTGGPIPDFHTPLTTFVGRGVYVDFKDTVAPYTHITKADLDRVAYKVKEGDIVIIDSAYKLEPFTKATNTEVDKRLLIDAESAEWFRDHKVKAVGFGDGVSIENCNEDVKPFHDILLAENIIFIEVLKNLELLEKDVFFMSFSPLPIVGLDSSPVHAYAIEGIKEFSE